MSDWAARHGLSHLQNTFNSESQDRSNLEDLVKALAGVITLHIPEAAPTVSQLIKNHMEAKRKIRRYSIDPD